MDVFLDALRRTKMELPHIEDVTVEYNNELIPFKNIFNEYQNQQKRHNFFNYDDMIYLALRIILKNSILRNELQNKFEYLLIDEFQDLNKAQILLMQIIALPQNNLFIVGDDDQMIYGWRGAEIKHIISFNKRYSESEDCTLSTNYRSNKRIVNHSKWLIDYNIERVKKDIKPIYKKPSGIFNIKLSSTLWHQALDVVEWIEEIKNKYTFDWKDFAILFRYNSYQFIVAMLLDSHKILHTPVDGKRLFQTNVGKDVFSYLRVILYPNKATSDNFSRILKRPNRSLSNEIINKINNWNDLQKSPNIDDLQQFQRNKLRDVVNKFKLLIEKVNKDSIEPSSLISMMAIEFSLKDFYNDQTRQNISLDDAADDILLEVITSMAKEFKNIEDYYGHIYNSINNEENQPEHDNEEEQKKVVLSTIHRTKGNEFSNVIYFNLMNNDRLTKQSEIEEERRVTYVGVTRAIKNILITAPEIGYSNFLTQLAYNPEFKNITNTKLNNILAKNRRSRNLLLKKIQLIEQKIKSLLKTYPELEGKEYKSGRIFPNIMFWVRQKFVDNATKKIEKLENIKNELSEKELLPTKDRIEKIEIELNNREILSIT